MWSLETNNLTDNRDVFNVLGLRLFSTNQRVNSTLALVDPQAQYSLNTSADFIPVLDLEPPTPTVSNLYVLDDLVSIEDLEEIFNINLLKEGSYYLDYVENKTYLLSQNTDLIITSTSNLEFADFIEINYFYSYTFDTVQSFDISLVNVNGLKYYPGNFTFDGQTLTITASQCCGPQPGDTFELTKTYSESSYSKRYLVYLFDFSSDDIDMVDSLTYKNKQFQFSSEVVSNTLLFNRVLSLAICIGGEI